jgi:outer membrane lipoprotein-sorting protein
MRRITVFFAIAAFAITSVSAQDLDKILNDHYKASAQDKMSKISSVTIKGNVSAMGMDMGLTLYQSRPSKLRMEADFAGSKIIQTYNGTTGWTYAPAMGITEPQQLGTEELKSIMKQAEMDSPLWDYKAKGNKVELLGTSDDGSAYKLKVTAPEGDVMTIFIDKETSLISKMVSSQNVNGMDAEIETEVKDYKNVKGIPVAHYMATKMGGQVVSTITFDNIEYDQKLDAALFEKPVVE